MKLKQLLVYSKQQRSALIFLIGLIITIQILYVFIDWSPSKIITKDEEKWMALQTSIDSLNGEEQEKKEFKIYPFNPNYITDFKGYTLGMTTHEIDRLLRYRNEGKFVNSVQEFQEITKVSDSLLAIISPYFKFPDWVNRKQEKIVSFFKKDTFEKKITKKVVQVRPIDINEATQEDLLKVYGIGEVLSQRILKYRARLGGFVTMEQINEVWGLSNEVIVELKKRFTVSKSFVVSKIKINDASIKDLMRLPYIKFSLAKEIIIYRSMNNGIHSVEDLIKVNEFPVEKVKIIALYLDFQ